MTEKSTKERLSSIETNIENIKEDITEIKEATKGLPYMKAVTGFFSLIISAVVAGVTSFLMRNHQ